MPTSSPAIPLARPPENGVLKPAGGTGERAANGNFLAVARGADLVIIKVVGMGDMLTAPALNDFVEEERKAGFRRFVFDMERCRGLDSTFMGVMVGIYTAMKADSEVRAADRSERQAAGRTAHAPELSAPELRESAISAVNVSAQLRKLLSMLGVDRFVRVRGNYALGTLETTVLPGRLMNPDERRQLILKAHQNLVAIDVRNHDHFGPFLEKVSTELYS